MIDQYKIMRMFTHKNIHKVNDIMINDKNLRPSILFESCSTNLEVEVKNKKFTKVQRVLAVCQFAKRMKYIDSRSIVHHNLIASSILISDDGTVKISGLMKPSQHHEIELKEMEDFHSSDRIACFISTEGKEDNIKNENVLKEFPLLNN